MGGVHIWLLKLFEDPVENLIRIEWIKRPRVSMGSSQMLHPKSGGRSE